MSDDATLRALRASPLFREFNDAQLLAMADALDCRRYAEGHVFSKTGHRTRRPQDALFIILDGEVAVSTAVQTAHQVPVERRLKPGEMFGLITFLKGGSRTANTQAASPVHIASLTHDHYEQLIRADPALNSAFLLAVASQLARDVRACNQRLAAAINKDSVVQKIPARP